MKMMKNEAEVYHLPDGAFCGKDKKKRSPLELEECPIGCGKCEGNCFYYREPEEEVTAKKESKKAEENRIFLMKQKAPLVYYILNSDTDYIGARHCGIPSIIHTDCIAAAESMTALLHQLQELKDGKWYVETDWVGRDGKSRHEEYPTHQGLHRLDGYIKEVCDIRKEEKSYLRDFEINFVSELWVRHSDNEMLRVSEFNKNMLLEVEQYIKENNLKIEKMKSEVDK